MQSAHQEIAAHTNAIKDIQFSEAGRELKFVSVKEVLEKFNISRATLYRWIDDVELNFPKPKKVRGCIFWVNESLDNWIKEAGVL